MAYVLHDRTSKQRKQFHNLIVDTGFVFGNFRYPESTESTVKYSPGIGCPNGCPPFAKISSPKRVTWRTSGLLLFKDYHGIQFIHSWEWDPLTRLPTFHVSKTTAASSRCRVWYSVRLKCPADGHYHCLQGYARGNTGYRSCSLVFSILCPQPFPPPGWKCFSSSLHPALDSTIDVHLLRITAAFITKTKLR